MRSVLGSNLRNLMLLLGKSTVHDINIYDLEKLSYHKIEEMNMWKINCIKEIIDVKTGVMEVPGFTNTELNTILCHLCSE